MVRVRIRVMIGFSVWLVSCYAHVFVLVQVVIVTLHFRVALLLEHAGGRECLKRRTGRTRICI